MTRTAPEIRVAVSTVIFSLRRRDTADGATIHGGMLHGGCVEAHGDHRIAMAFAVAAQCAQGEVRIGDVANVATSFPGFDALARGAGMRLDAA